jgi:hypothetical protein
MKTILDYTTGAEDRELLTSTEVSGRIRSGQLLADDPLATYLEGDEEPKYVLRNRKSGVTVEDDDSTRIQPDDAFQALALVTDVRVLFVVGTAGGDRTESVSYSSVVPDPPPP